MRIDLPDSNWAEVRDPDDLFEDDRRAVARRAIVEFNPATKTRIMRGDIDGEMGDALLERIITAWSYPFKVPAKDPTALGKLRISHARALRDAISPHFKVINGTEDDESDDAEDPTEPESGS